MPPATPMRILMVDDSDTILNQDGSALTLAGYDVITTTQPFAATRLLSKIDLVILDFHMPGMDGGELVSEMREVCEKSGSSCLFYLNTLDADVARDFKRYGFDGVLSGKGDGKALVAQVKAAERAVKLRALTERVAKGSKP